MSDEITTRVVSKRASSGQLLDIKVEFNMASMFRKLFSGYLNQIYQV